MSRDPTYEEWQAARERVLALWPHNVSGDTHWDKVLVAILGPCPPKPVPMEWKRMAVRMLYKVDRLCGRGLLDLLCGRGPRCQRPKGHPGACRR